MSFREQLLKFSGVGFIVTAIDFILLNVLRLFGLPLIASNLVSSSIAMVVSYRLNKNHVFKKDTTNIKQKIIFIGGTLFGLYIVQTLIIHGFEMQKSQLLSVVMGIPYFAQHPEIAFTNITKIFATAVTAVWNFTLYKFVVFRRSRRSLPSATARRAAAVLLNRL